MRKTIVLYLLTILLSAGINAQKPVDLSPNPKNIEWFNKDRFGIFVHFGLYSILGGSYEGTILSPDIDTTKFPHSRTWYAEWIQMKLNIPRKDYQDLAKSFNPVNFNADEWIREVKNAGAKYFIITAKHHDGFALWNSKVSDFNIMHTPFKRDILAELVAACKKYGIKYGFYYSHWQDWEDPNGAVPYDFIEKRSSEAFEKYWQGKCLPQVKELIQKFDPDLLWFDTWGTEGQHITPKRRDELIALVRANSKKCLINGRIAYANPGENVDFLEMGDNEFPKEKIGKAWETSGTMQNSWGWHAYDFNWKPAKEFIANLIGNASKGGNYALNIGPKPDGTLPVPAIARLREMGAWNFANGEAVFGASPVSLTLSEKDVYLTQKSIEGINYVYINIIKPLDKITIPTDIATFKDCVVLETGMPVKLVADGTGTLIVFPKSLFKDCSPVTLKLRTTDKL